MPDISYTSIEPLLVRAEQIESIIHCTFECPITGDRYDAGASIDKNARFTHRPFSSREEGLLGSLRPIVRRTILKAVGYRHSDGAGKDGVLTPPMGYATSERQAAIVRAFEQVAKGFTWDDRTQRWISVRALGEMATDFGRQLHSAPITERYDRGILAHMLIECAHADQQLTGEEMAFLADFIAPALVSIGKLITRSPLTEVELKNTYPGASRETMLMLAWALALIDQNLSAEEAERLELYAAGLDIADEQARALKRYAQIFLIDQAIGQIYVRGKFDEQDQEQVTRFAEQIGLHAVDVVRTLAAYRKRHKLV